MAVRNLDFYSLRIVEPSMQYTETKRQIVCPCSHCNMLIFFLRKTRKRYVRGNLQYVSKPLQQGILSDTLSGPTAKRP
jgi:hypothetical protein